MKTPSKNWIAAPFLLLLIVIPVIWLFTAAPLHPNPHDVPSVLSSAPLPEWASTVTQAQQIVRTSLSEQNLPGLSVAVGVDGDVVWAEGFGYADLQSRAPVAPNHRFRIGSTSTMLASAAAGLLIEEGRLKLDQEIRSYVPELPRKELPLTLRQMMGHNPGIAPDDNGENTLYSRHCERPVDAFQHFDNWLFGERGPQGPYSPYDWIIVSAAIEAAARQPFLTFMQQRVFEPLGMHDTAPDPAPEADDDFPLINLFREKVFDPRISERQSIDAASAKALTQDRVTSYYPRLAHDPNYGLHLMRPVDYSCYAGASVFVSTPSDLVRYGMAINSGKLLRPATVQTLRTSQRLASGKETGYGLGWNLGTITLVGQPVRVAGHNGDSLGGMVSSLLTIPDQQIAVSVIANISYADTASLAKTLAQLFAKPR